MARAHHRVDCALFQAQQHREAGDAEGSAPPPHTTLVPFSAEEEERADAEAAQSRAERETRAAERAQAERDRALLLEHGATHEDPVVQAAARLLAR